MVHHPIWDYDPPAAPTLIDIAVEGREIPAVAQVTKQGLLFTFDRRTGLQLPAFAIDLSYSRRR